MCVPVGKAGRPRDIFGETELNRADGLMLCIPGSNFLLSPEPGSSMVEAGSRQGRAGSTRVLTGSCREQQDAGRLQHRAEGTQSRVQSGSSKKQARCRRKQVAPQPAGDVPAQLQQEDVGGLGMESSGDGVLPGMQAGLISLL